MRNVWLGRIVMGMIIGTLGCVVTSVADAQEYREAALSPAVYADSPAIVAWTATGQDRSDELRPVSPFGTSGFPACGSGVEADLAAMSCPLLVGSDNGPATPARVRIDTNMLLRQGIAGAAGGLAGALLLVLPAAIAERGGQDVSSDVTSVLATIGYMGGSVVGVQYYSQRQGMKGSWWGTLGGAVLGGLGGPLFVLTVPTGAVIGFTLTPVDLLP